MKKKWPLIILALMNIGTVFAQMNSSDTAREKLMNALDQSSKASFVFQTQNPDILFYRTHSDSGKLLQRYERYNNGKMVEMSIMNEDGMFQIGRDYAVHFKMDDSLIKQMFGPLWNTFPTIHKLDERLKCEYKMKSTSRKSIPCYKITMICPCDNESLAAFYKMPIDNAKKYRNKLITKFPHIMVFTVGKQNGFIYALEVFSYTGEKISGVDLGEVKIVSSFDHALFEIPKDKKIETAKNIETVIKINKTHAAPQRPSIFSRMYSRMANFFSMNFGSILEWGGRIAFWLSIISVVSIVILKISQKRAA